MCITEYNEAETMKLFKEEGREEGRVEGRAEGREQGEERFAMLNRRLLQDKRYDTLERVIEDKVYRKKLYEEYNII